jgi:DNA helicase-2/ATP-dependent DNA helicase PcrA
MNDFLDDLNPRQREAVEYINGPLLILAGAGSGKTRVLVYKIAYLLSKCKAKPWEILALTFTNKAAEEMRSRIYKLVGNSARNIPMGTFHSFCARALRMFSEKLGFTKTFTIYDETDAKNLIKKIVRENDIGVMQTPKAIYSRISLAKNSFLSPEAFPVYSYLDERIAEIYDMYQKTLKENNALDFDDLLIKACELFENHQDARDRFSSKYILVDEYQDTNHVQYLIIKCLAAKHRNISVVGDDDQSIYRWRGADIRNIFDFESDFPDAKIIRLEENYRSTKNILRAASAVVKNNVNRMGKELRTKKEEGEQLSIFEAKDEEAEAQEIVRIIREEKRPLGEFVILYRTHAQSRIIEETLRREDIPYVIIGGVKFYDRKEIKDALAYLRVIANPNDDVALLRVINVPSRNIGESTIRVLEQFASSEGIPLYIAVGMADEIDELNQGQRNTLLRFYKMMEKCKREGKKPSKLLDLIFESTGYLGKLEVEGGAEALTRIENVKELIVSSEKYDNLGDFLNDVALLTDIDNWDKRSDKVTLMTAHNAKGLEFSVVLITGLEEGLFPHFSSLYDEDELEEERRLFYVGLTRSKEKVYLSYAQSRKRRGATLPSRFLGELPQDAVIF